MAPNHQFEYLPLLLRFRGPAKIQGGGKQAAQTKANKANAPAHSTNLRSSTKTAQSNWQTRQAQRQQLNLPVLPLGMPLLLQVDPDFDLEQLREKFGFEIVVEQEDGFVIIATEDIQLNAFLQMVNDFATQKWGSATVASIYKLFDDPNQEERLKRIMSEAMLAQWATLQDEEKYICDIGVECIGTIQIPEKLERGDLETDQEWAHRVAVWSQERDAAYQAWDDLQYERQQQIEQVIAFYAGTIHEITSPNPAIKFPDHFNLRVEIVGKGLRDLVLNHPHIFEVVEPDDILLPQRAREAIEAAKLSTIIDPPPADAPTVCVIDSGLQEGHFLLEPGVDRPSSRNFMPGASVTDVADIVPPAGHGTRVAGAVLYGDDPPGPGSHVTLPFWIQNARVLDAHGNLPKTLFPPDMLRAIVAHFHRGPRATRVFNHSLGARGPCRQRLMSAWAAEIDLLSAHDDVLFVVSAGNIPESQPSPFPGIRELLIAGGKYPSYLTLPACRIANPAQSLQALTVGSVAYASFNDGTWKSLAPDAGYPSAFTRTGFGIWGVIKPEVVEYGGDELINTATPPDVTTPDIGSICYPPLVRSTLHGAGPPFDRDGAVGTSFAVPKVARIAARLQQVLPGEPSLLYRALIVQSAKWPAWTEEILSPHDPITIMRWIGFGIPDVERATTNTDHRVTYITTGTNRVSAGESHIYQIPIPDAMRRAADEYDIRIEVTLSYAAQPRRTRRNLRRYLSTWVDWKSSRLGESLESFRIRALKGQEDDGTHIKGTPIPWTLDANPRWGTIKNIKRNAGTVQKDWAVVKSNSLPSSFCIGVVGHAGWNPDPDATARYAMAVSFEIVNREIPIYQPMHVAVAELQMELEVEVETKAAVEIEE
jgi:hypothetical protein